MTQFIVEANGKTFEYDNRADAEEHKETIESDFGVEATIKMGGEPDGGEVVEEPTHTVEAPPKPEESQDDPLAQLGEELGTDPLSILPTHMVDTIQGQPAVNKRGYAMIAERYGIEAKAEIVELPWENEEGRCVAKATAITEEGKEYSGWATAAESDGDMPEQLIELAETRSLKRCVSWASGVGIVSYQELASELE